MWYRLCSGSHAERVGDKIVIYRKNQVFQSPKDLRRHNKPGEMRFEPVHGPAAAAEAQGSKEVPPPDFNDTFEFMDDAELKRFAEDEDIDISSCETRAEIIATLRGAK